MSIAGHIKRDVDPLRRAHSGINLIFQPILRYFLLDHPYIPGVARTKIASAAGYTKTTLSPVGAETAIGPADRSAFTKGNLVGLFLRLGLWFFMGRGWNFLGFTLACFAAISIASGSFCSSTFGCDCVRPFDSLAKTFCVGAGFAGNGTVLTKLTPMASPPPPAPSLGRWSRE